MKRYKPDLEEMIKITWIDSYVMTNSPWEREEDLDDSADDDIVSIGFFLKRTKRFITFAQSLGMGGEYGGVFHIPVGCVLDITPILPVPITLPGDLRGLESDEREIFGII